MQSSICHSLSVKVEAYTSLEITIMYCTVSLDVNFACYFAHNIEGRNSEVS